MEYNYYTRQLSSLKNDPIYYKSIKVADQSGNTTNYLDLNLDSIPEIIKFLKAEQKRLKSIKKEKSND